MDDRKRGMVENGYDFIVNSMDTKNLAVIRQSFGNAVYTNKIQEIAAEFSGKKSFLIKVWNVFFVAVVLITLVLSLTYNTSIWSYIGAGVSIAEIVFLIIQFSFSFEEKEKNHKSFALKFRGIREDYIVLIADIYNGIPLEEVVKRRDYLQKNFQHFCDLAPQTGVAEYQEAQKRLNSKGIVDGEEFTFSDEEIDRFLPPELRFSSHV